MLYAGNNQLTILPETLGQLSQLTELKLENNRLITLPSSLSKLNKLKRLEVSDNLLGSVTN
ncbi:MAG: hypothetical protein KDF59_07790 [Nitrosomonas sp.]|nr:hypothetical protein [Nitrosomonas sp.]